MSDAALPVVSQSADVPNFEEMLKKLNDELKRSPFKSIEKFRFSFDGLDFEVHRAQRENDASFLINVTVGYMPFTIESGERREAIKTIIIASRRLPKVRFGVDTSSKILAGAVFDGARVERPDFIFYPLTLFMQEAWPFIKLIGKYLSSQPAPKPGPVTSC
ncbi:MAG: hypothetical protein PHW76_04330 [Alphaproteobacteria bacterium]|nr:hypothetical protein [Alphaproteobacteria bacterium]